MNFRRRIRQKGTGVETGCVVERTCVVCRKVADKYELLRFVLAPDRAKSEVVGATAEATAGKLVFDGEYSLEGRGAYCHPRCIHSSVGRELRRSLVKQKKGMQHIHCDIEAVLRSGVEKIRPDELRAEVSSRLAKIGALGTGTPTDAPRSGKRTIRL